MESFIEITEGKISRPSVEEQIRSSSFGAEVVFCGVVRNLNQGRKVIAIEYDCFTPLAKTVFAEICGEAQKKWGSELRIAVIHRKGRLEVGEISVIVGVGSPHREEAFSASRYVIDQLKHRAPIWKKEYYEDGETEWLDGHALCGNHAAKGTFV